MLLTVSVLILILLSVILFVRARRAETRYRALFEEIPVPMWITDRDSRRFLSVNRAATDLYGHSPGEFVALKEFEIQRGTEAVHHLKNGRTIPVELTVRDIVWRDAPARLVAVCDLSKHAALENQFHACFQQSPQARFIWKRNRIADCNASAVSLLGATSRESLLGLRPADILPDCQPDGRSSSSLCREYGTLVAQGQTPRFDCMHKRLDGTLFPAEICMNGFEFDGAPALLSTVTDLTERNRDREALLRRKARLREAQEIAGIAQWEMELPSGASVCDDITLSIVGMKASAEPLSRAIFLAGVHSQDRPRLQGCLDAAALHGTPYEIEYRYLTPGGETRYIHERARCNLNPAGLPERVAGTVMDVTAQRRMYAALQISEARFHAFMDNSPAFAFIKDRDGRMLYMNRVCLETWNLGNTGWRGKLDSELWSPQAAQAFRELDLLVLEQNAALSTIEEVALPDGGMACLFTWKFPFEMEDGTRYVAGVAINITQQRRLEEELRQSLAEREILLKEVHHRVKNNLQVVCSLLSLQAFRAEDEKTAAMLHESESRVQAMALIHEMLYGSKTLGDIDFGDYAKRLAGEIFDFFGIAASAIALRLECAPFQLGIDRAIPCGLILNELVSNALKHAFQGRLSGEIRISLADAGSGSVVLSVADDGVGLPPGFSLQQSNSLGLRIVQILTRQLNGDLRVTHFPGSRFDIVFARTGKERANRAAG